MKKLFSLLSFLLIAAGAWADYYTPSSAYTQGDAVIYATVVTNEAGADAYSYEVGAFVDDMCIGNAKPLESQAIYTIRARGNEDLVGKTIEFRAYNQNSGMEYKLTPSQDITFQLTGTYGYPSQLVTLTLTAPTSITLDNFEIEVGETVNLLDYVHITPAGATLPLNGEWYIEGDDAAFVFEENLNLTGVKPGIISYMYEVGDERYYGVCTIVLRATAINILTDEFEVQRDDGESLSMFMRNLYPESGGNYQLVPAGATDKVYWELKDDGVIVQEEENVWYPRKAGTTQIRPYFINKSGTKVYPANNKWITINVWVQLENIILDFPGSMVYANVGDDIYQRLVDHLSFSPEDATVSGYTFSTNAPDLLTISGTSALVKAAGEGTIRVTAEGLTAEVAFTFFDPLKEVTFKKNPLNLDKTISKDKLLGEIEGNILLSESRGLQEGTIAMSGVITGSGSYQEDGWWGIDFTYSQLQKGTATITVTCGWKDYSTNDEGTLVWGTPKSFIINIGVSLNRMTVTVTPDASDPTKGVITLTPDPSDADVNWADFPVNVEFEWGNSWNTIELTDNGNGKTNYSAEMPGTYIVAPVGGADPEEFEVPYKAVQASGWQWCSNPYGEIDNVEENTFDDFFGDNFAEARTFGDLLINDPSWGLFGTMLNSGIRQGEMYKLKMDGAHTGFLHSSQDIVSDHTLAQGWNWIGSPFFYNRYIGNAINTNYLVKNMVIVSKSDGSAEWDGTKWVGDLKIIKKGQGYLVYSPSANVEFYFNDEQDLAPGNEVEPAGTPRRNANISPWQYDHSQFADNMTMVAKVEGMTDFDRYTIGAFVGDECRGEGEFIDGLAFITVHGNIGEKVSFRLYDINTDEYLDIDQTVVSKTRLGSLDNPVNLSSQPLVTGINTIRVDNGISSETYDASGRRINGLQRGLNILRQPDGTVRKVMVK